MEKRRLGSPYAFKPGDAEDFARHIGARTFQKGNELFFTYCPYCNGGGRDKNTFSIDLRSGKFHCFRAGCGRNGNMLSLARDFDFSLGQNADEYYQPRRHYRRFKKPKEPIKPTDAAITYLESRGISAAIANNYHVTEKDGKIAFPHMDADGNIVTIKYRNPSPKEGESKEWFEANCKPILYGMRQCNSTNKTLIVTEGQIDALSVAEAGMENAVSVPGGARGFTWVPYCWDWMSQWERIIIFGDHEHGHITLYDEFRERWKSKVWHVREADYLDCKDANEILQKYGKEQVRICVEHAEQPPIRRVVDLSEVKDINPDDKEKLRTCLWKLDEVLHGGLPFGQLTLFTGKAGDGKSTLANQMIVYAINQGYKCFVYSGELPGATLKSWMTSQAAGPDYIIPVRNPQDEEKIDKYVIDEHTREQINNWFHERVWIYDSDSFEDEDEEPVKIIELLEETIARYGVRVILLDNLMTAMDMEPGGIQDKYDRQSVFIKKLTRIAMKYNVLVMLVAHKRKNAGGDVNDTVSGSADIVNLASVVISYERSYDPTETRNIRWLKVTKNRNYGDLSKGILMEYDPASKRVFEEKNNGERKKRLNWIYEWADSSALEEVEEDVLPWDENGKIEGGKNGEV